MAYDGANIASSDKSILRYRKSERPETALANIEDNRG